MYKYECKTEDIIEKVIRDRLYITEHLPSSRHEYYYICSV